MNKETISSKQAPTAIGPYSQAVKVGNTVYLSGQIPLDPQTGDLVNGDFNSQARQVFKNLEAVAKAASGSLSDAVKLTVYLTDLDNFNLLNDVMAEVLSPPFPARAAVQASALPKGAIIEIDAILSL